MRESKIIHTYKFFAAPNPPGKMTASKSDTDSSVSGLIAPLAILADSTKTFLEILYKNNSNNWSIPINDLQPCYYNHVLTKKSSKYKNWGMKMYFI